MPNQTRDAPTVLLLPGLLCDATIWSHQQRSLAPNFTIQIPRFLGLSSIRAMAEHTLADAPARFALAGHSMGGRVAIEIHRLAPERVERLMLLDTGIAPKRVDEEPNRRRLVELAYKDGMKALAEVWLPPMLHPNHRSDPAITEPLTQMICRATPSEFEGEVEALLGRPDASSEIEKIRCPTFVLCGRQDEWSPLERHERIHRAIPHSQLVIIEDSGHMTTVEHGEAVSRAMRDWLAVT